MAKLAAVIKQDPKALLNKEALDRLAEARTKKSYVELDFRECYFFCAPQRQRTINSTTEPSTQRMLDAPELNTDEAFLLCQDFVTEVINTFMPEAQPWCRRGPGMDIADGAWAKVKDAVSKDDDKIFSAMKASNLYPELAKAFYPDLAIGTVAAWIDRPHPSKPITVAAVPLRELEINLGPYGEVDDRFAVRYTRNSYVKELVGDEVWAKIPAEMKEKIEEKPSVRTQVIWGFWRDWSDVGDETWFRVVLVGNELVDDGKLKGEGSCPLWVARFNPSADWPHGIGPMIQGLPSFRQIDELESMLIENAELALVPPITYPSDSFTNIEQGLEPRMAYPIQPGHEKAVQAIYQVPPAAPGTYAYEDKLKKLKKLFYVDMPEQSGDTPPTLGQWLDEMARAQRRIGTPGLSFWREGPAKIFSRFQHLLELSGAIKPLQVDGRAVATLPMNPAQAAAEQQEVAMAMKAVQFLGQAFPEEFKMFVDGEKSIQAIIEKMRVGGLLKLRDADKVKEAVAQMAPLVKGHIAGAPDQPPGPAA
jgi:hypothetical protein